jgi:hypothetical protein
VCIACFTISLYIRLTHGTTPSHTIDSPKTEFVDNLNRGVEAKSLGRRINSGDVLSLTVDASSVTFFFNGDEVARAPAAGITVAGCTLHTSGVVEIVSPPSARQLSAASPAAASARAVGVYAGAGVGPAPPERKIVRSMSREHESVAKKEISSGLHDTQIRRRATLPEVRLCVCVCVCVCASVCVYMCVCVRACV